MAPCCKVATEITRGLKDSRLPPGFAIAAIAATAAAAAAAAITTVTTAATATAATATETATTAAAAGAIFTRLSFIDGQTASIDFLAIELFDSLCSFFLAGHFDEAEAARTSGVAVFHDARGFDRAGLRE